MRLKGLQILLQATLQPTLQVHSLLTPGSSDWPGLVAVLTGAERVYRM